MSHEKAGSTPGSAGPTLALMICILASLAGLAGRATVAAAEPECSNLRIGGELPLPCSKPLADYEKVLYTWLNQRRYAELEGWEKDKRVRDTGPFVLNGNYGTHPAVRIHYSPEVVTWLRQDREGSLPVGSMIVKEMFAAPSARVNEKLWREHREDVESWDAWVAGQIHSWTVMIKDGQTHDGWFWAGASAVSKEGKTAEEWQAAIAATLDSNDYPFAFRDSDHGQASCLRCHSSAEAESTFADRDNIEGDELRFRVDASWRSNLPPEQRPARGEKEAEVLAVAYHGVPPIADKYDEDEITSQPLAAPDPEFTRYFQLAEPLKECCPEVRAFPGQWADHVPAGPDGAEQFITSDNCIGCHGGLGGAPSGITMFLQTGPEYGDGYNISPFGEWRWSPMGLAGRDPAFYSQLATELAILDAELEGETLAEARNAVVNTCLSCHGGMGQRQLWIDWQKGQGVPLDPNFRVDYVYTHEALTEAQKKQPDYEYRKYGNLAREGIGCTLCHHIDPPEGWRDGMDEDRKEEIFLMTSTTGQFPYSPPDELNGPFDDVLVHPMESALGITPERNDYIRESRMCGTCHTINLPNVDCPLEGHPDDPKRCKPLPALNESAKAQAARLDERYGAEYAGFLANNFSHSIEQATYLEWKNSVFGDMESPETYRSCQDCHMPRKFKSPDGSIDIARLRSQIASIQDSNYPMASNALPPEELFVPFRSDYRRHELVGLNVFLVEMFDQFDPILGIAEQDYMTSAVTGDRLAVENMLRQAREETVKLSVEVKGVEGQEVTADVTVESLVGHRLPSGVAFRRAWIELTVLDGDSGGEVAWASGRTNSVGLIVDGNGEPLSTEFFADNDFQPHYHGIPPADGGETPPITRQDQVQIYEEVTVNAEDQVTFSFIHRDEHLKDNRLLPRGWRPSRAFARSEILEQFMEATDPEGVGADPDYTEDNTGRDRVRYRITLPDGVDPAKATVRARMFYQAFQPFWFKRKFDLSGDHPATRRLYYLASRLDTAGTVIDQWKLPLAATEAEVSAALPIEVTAP